MRQDCPIGLFTQGLVPSVGGSRFSFHQGGDFWAVLVYSWSPGALPKGNRLLWWYPDQAEFWSGIKGAPYPLLYWTLAMLLALHGHNFLSSMLFHHQFTDDETGPQRVSETTQSPWFYFPVLVKINPRVFYSISVCHSVCLSLLTWAVHFFLSLWQLLGPSLYLSVNVSFTQCFGY